MLQTIVRNQRNFLEVSGLCNLKCFALHKVLNLFVMALAFRIHIDQSLVCVEGSKEYNHHNYKDVKAQIIKKKRREGRRSKTLEYGKYLLKCL